MIARLSADTQLEKQEAQRGFDARIAAIETAHKEALSSVEARAREWEVKYYQASGMLHKSAL